MDTRDSAIFLTDKYGTRDRTAEIENISYNAAKGLWDIEFAGAKHTFSYKTENVKIVKNCLRETQSAAVFDFLLQMAEFSSIQNDDGQNLLVKKLEKSRFVNDQSVLAVYLNPQKKKAESKNVKSLIFPFGSNTSQFKAVRTALHNQISIIQGPPGTGKTQTILNIIANLLMYSIHVFRKREAWLL